MEEGVTSTDLLAFQEQRHHHETEQLQRDEDIAEMEDSRESKENFSEDRGVKEEEKGVITNFISNLVAPRNREAENIEGKDDRMDSDGVGRGDFKLEGYLDGGNGGGTVNKIISNLFQPSEARGTEEVKGNEKEEKSSDVKIKDRGGGGGGGGGGGIIETLVSHLAKTFPDDMAPPPEEASILIHSIVHD